jgi:hypothetical protein
VLQACSSRDIKIPSLDPIVTLSCLLRMLSILSKKHAVQPPRTSEDTGEHAERDPRRNGMDNPFGASLDPLHPQLALLTGGPLPLQGEGLGSPA